MLLDRIRTIAGLAVTISILAVMVIGFTAVWLEAVGTPGTGLWLWFKGSGLCRTLLIC